MRLSSNSSASRDDSSSLNSRPLRRPGETGSAARGPTLHLHLAGDLIGWSVVSTGHVAELLAAGTAAVIDGDVAATLLSLVTTRGLPVRAARVAVPGDVGITARASPDGDSAAADLAPGLDVAYVALADGRRLRAQPDTAALDAALLDCAAAGIEVVGAEPESLALARALATSAGELAPDAGVAVAYVTAARVLVARACGSTVELLGSRDLPASVIDLPVTVQGLAMAAADGLATSAADAVADLLAGTTCVEVVVAASGVDADDVAAEIAAATGLAVRVGDPVSRIRCAPAILDDAAIGGAAVAIGLGLDVRGLPRVELPVSPARARRAAGAPHEPEGPELEAALPESALPEAAVEVPAPAVDAPTVVAKAEAEPALAGPEAAAHRHHHVVRVPNRTIAMAVAGMVVAGALVAAWAFTERAAVRDRRAVMTTLQNQLDGIPSPTAPTRRLLVLGADRRARVDAIATVLGSRVAWDRILREVSAVLPADAWLTDISADGGTTPQLHLRGYAKTSEAVALTLSRLGIVSDLTDVRLGRSDRVTVSGASVLRFSVTAGVRGEKP